MNQDGSEKVALRDAIQELGAEIIGQELMDTYGGWPMYSKFFDNNVPLFHHLHLDNEAAARVGRLGKPEAYYFPPQLNNHLGEFPATYFGFDPDVKKEEVRACLECFEDRDNRITELSRAYRIELGTGWYTPAGVVHAPGSVLTDVYKRQGQGRSVRHSQATEASMAMRQALVLSSALSMTKSWIVPLTTSRVTLTPAWQRRLA